MRGWKLNHAPKFIFVVSDKENKNCGFCRAESSLLRAGGARKTTFLITTDKTSDN